MLTEKLFEFFLNEINPDFGTRKFLLALSGGADSMVLAQLFFRLRIHFETAHINYKLRGEDSNADQEIVEKFCEKNQIKLHLYEVSGREQEPKNNIQLWARNLRYEYFFKILQQEKLDYIVTAHHLNDDLETFFINLSRGSGIRGLSGIPANDNLILRPLLRVTKQEIYDFAKENSVEFREDQSNIKNDYLRNKFRNIIIPEIKTFVPNFEEQFRHSLQCLKNADTFIEKETARAFAAVLMKKHREEIVLDRAKFLALDAFLRDELILKFGFRGDEIAKIIRAENGKMFRSKSHEIFISGGEIACRPRN